MKQRNNVVSIGVEYKPHEQERIIPREHSTYFYHPLWAMGVFVVILAGGIGAYFY